MKKLLLILLCFPQIILGQQTYVPDDNFEAYLEAYNMGNGIANDDSVTTSNIVGITSLNIPIQAISDLTGIEDFSALVTLYCYSNQLSSLDVSNNTALTYLDCRSNQLTSLDVSNNTALTYLDCPSNQLTSLDVSQNTALTDLYCYSNQLTSLDVSNNTALTGLSCSSNQLTSLDVSQNTALTGLGCSSNQLTSLDVSNNTALTELYCSSNQLTSLDVSNNTALTILLCNSNQVTSLDVSNNTVLFALDCNSNQLTSLDVSNNTALTDLYCPSNQLTSLDVRNGNNQNLLTFNVTSNPNLTCINVDDVNYSTNNWTNIDAQHYFSTNCSSPNSVQEIPHSIYLYPNPTNENVTISIENFNGNIQTEVYDLIGNKLQTTNKTTISLRDYSKGIYILKVTYGDRIEEVKVIKD